MLHIIRVVFIFITVITVCCTTIAFVYFNKCEQLPTKTARDLNKHNTLQQVREITNCIDKPSRFRIDQNGDFFVLYNFVAARKYFFCHESVTYTTQADYTFLDNVEELVERWRGPISVAVFAPGDDFAKTKDSIAYLRHCRSKLISEFVSFHVVLPVAHFMNDMNITYTDNYNCSQSAPLKENTYRNRLNLTYPINIVRNVARNGATTHFVLASDIELYPSERFIPKFLEMIASGADQNYSPNHVYALAVFELAADQTIPRNKSELVKKFKRKKAFWFHQKLCDRCHAIPERDKWIKKPENNTYRGFSVTKRLGKFRFWEAFYVGTQDDPIFDERMIWEGQQNKMVQGFAMCLLDYDYVVLDNAFLVHRPGLKKFKDQMRYYKEVVRQYFKFAQYVVKRQLEVLYGKRAGCTLGQ